MLTFSKLGNLGRLGNQLFQIAFITSFAKKHNIEYQLPYWKYESFFDFNFNFHENINDLHFDLVLKEPTLAYNEDFYIQHLPAMRKQNVNIIFGYFQSHKYFCREHVLEIFKPKVVPKFQINTSKSIAIHIRRGDFVSHQDYNNIEGSQYRKLLSQFRGFKVFVFSDDYKYCLQEFIGSQYEFAIGLNEIETLQLMSKFERFILSNSTFSYWGPMLAKNPKLVLYPKFMFPYPNRCEIYNNDYWPKTPNYHPYHNEINK